VAASGSPSAAPVGCPVYCYRAPSTSLCGLLSCNQGVVDPLAESIPLWPQFSAFPTNCSLPSRSLCHHHLDEKGRLKWICGDAAAGCVARDHHHDCELPENLRRPIHALAFWPMPNLQAQVAAKNSCREIAELSALIFNSDLDAGYRRSRGHDPRLIVEGTGALVLDSRRRKESVLHESPYHRHALGC